MTIQEIKELLSEYYDIEKRIFEVNIELKKYQDEKKYLYDNIRTPLFDSMPRGNAKSDETAGKVQKSIDVY